MKILRTLGLSLLAAVVGVVSAFIAVFVIYLNSRPDLSPSAATSTPKPIEASLRRRSSRNAVSSSTTRMRMVWPSSSDEWLKCSERAHSGLISPCWQRAASQFSQNSTMFLFLYSLFPNLLYGITIHAPRIVNRSLRFQNQKAFSWGDSSLDSEMKGFESRSMLFVLRFMMLFRSPRPSRKSCVNTPWRSMAPGFRTARTHSRFDPLTH